jgi:hypothetical protein
MKSSAIANNVDVHRGAKTSGSPTSRPDNACRRMTLSALARGIQGRNVEDPRQEVKPVLCGPLGLTASAAALSRVRPHISNVLQTGHAEHGDDCQGGGIRFGNCGCRALRLRICAVVVFCPEYVLGAVHDAIAVEIALSKAAWLEVVIGPNRVI